MKYFWNCPLSFKDICLSEKSSILKLSAEVYKNILPVPSEINQYQITLNLKKDFRSYSKSFMINIKKPFEKLLENNENQDFSEIILLSPLSNDRNNEILFNVSFLDKSLDLFSFNYYWTIDHFKNQEQYLNGRKEINLKILNADLLIGENKILLDVVMKGKIYTKMYVYEKRTPPYGGNCILSPQIGTSLRDEFIFNISGWMTKSEPLVYKIKYLDSNRNYINISKDGFAENKWKSNLIPVANNYILEATDSSGLSSTIICFIKVNVNNQLKDLEFYLEKEIDLVNRVLLVDVYKSNIVKLPNSQNNSNINNVMLDILDSYFNASSLNIPQDLENIIARIFRISKEKFNIDKLWIVLKSIKIILENIDVMLQNLGKIQNVYKIVDSIFKKAMEIEEFKNEKNLLETLQNSLALLNSKVFGNLISGQGISIQNENYNSQMNKVSSLNFNDISLDYISIAKKSQRIKIRYLQPSDSCNQSTAICIPKENITNIMNNHQSKNLGFHGQINHNEILPIEEKQFSNSLDFTLSTEKNDQVRGLNIDELNINFEIRLKMPRTANLTQIEEATCVQYKYEKKKFPDTSCLSWYDIDTYEVVCSCNKQGLTINILDKTLSNISKLNQFPQLTTDICHKKDNVDKISLFYQRFSKYDFMQYYINSFQKEGFGEKIIFWRLFKYMIKNLHPIISILNIYDPIYSRSLRTIDFFLSIYFSFFFNLMPYYFTKNEKLVDMEASRLIHNRNKNINDLSVFFSQILDSAIYSLFALVVTRMITIIINLFLYENILIKEAVKKKKIINKALNKLNPEFLSLYQIKIKKGLFKLRTIIIMIGKKLDRKSNSYDCEDIPRRSYCKQLSNKKNIIKKNEKNINQESLERSQRIDSYIQFMEKQNTLCQTNFLDNFKSKEEENQKILKKFSKIEWNKRKIKNDLNEEKKTNFNSFHLFENGFEESRIKDTKSKKGSKDYKNNYEKISELGQLKTKNNEIQTTLIDESLSSSRQESSDFMKTRNMITKKSNRQKYLKNNFVINLQNLSMNINHKEIFIQSGRTLLKKNFILELDQEISRRTIKKQAFFDIFLKVEVQEGVFLKGKNRKVSTSKKMHFNLDDRQFLFKTKFSDKIKCYYITISPFSYMDNKNDFIYIIKKSFKMIIVGFLFLFLWFYIALFIQSIYKQYGKNIFQICIVPFLSIFFMNLLIVFNFLMLISTIIMFFNGKDYIFKKKNSILQKFIFQVFVPPMALNHYSAIITYQALIRIK